MWSSSLPPPPSRSPNWLPTDRRGPLVLWEGPPLLQPPEALFSDTPDSDSVVMVPPEPQSCCAEPRDPPTALLSGKGSLMAGSQARAVADAGPGDSWVNCTLTV